MKQKRDIKVYLTQGKFFKQRFLVINDLFYLPLSKRDFTALAKFLDIDPKECIE